MQCTPAARHTQPAFTQFIDDPAPCCHARASLMTESVFSRPRVIGCGSSPSDADPASPFPYQENFSPRIKLLPS
jgi:hypothetical protein